jgi:hypothetical protein
MTITISTISKTVYWLATGFTATAYLVIGAADILHASMTSATTPALHRSNAALCPSKLPRRRINGG